MRAKFASLFITLGLIAASGVGGAWLGAKLIDNTGTTHQDFHDRLFSELRLAPAQRTRMDALEVRHALEDDALHESLANANRALAHRLSEESQYTDKVEAAVEDVHTAMLELQKASVRHLYEMREILDDRQQKTFDRHVAETMQRYADQSSD